RRLTDEKEQFSVQLREARRRELTAQLRESEAGLDGYQAQIAELRRGLERGRMQVGFGGPEYTRDAKVRQRYVYLVQRELALAAAGQMGEDAQEFAQEANPFLVRLQRVQARLDQLRDGYDAEVASKSRELLA